MESPARTFPPDLFSDSDRRRVRGHTSPLAVARFLFDPNVGNWNPSSNHLKPMSFGSEMFLLGRSPARTTLREITVEALLHLIAENDTEISASLPLDLLCSLLMEAGRDRRRGFAGPGESVVENLTFAGALRIGEETMAVLGGGAKAQEFSLGSEAPYAHRPAQPSPVRVT
jgi:hypothetical protein